MPVNQTSFSHKVNFKGLKNKLFFLTLWTSSQWPTFLWFRVHVNEPKEGPAYWPGQQQVHLIGLSVVLYCLGGFWCSTGDQKSLCGFGGTTGARGDQTVPPLPQQQGHTCPKLSNQTLPRTFHLQGVGASGAQGQKEIIIRCLWPHMLSGGGASSSGPVGTATNAEGRCCSWKWAWFQWEEVLTTKVHVDIITAVTAVSIAGWPNPQGLCRGYWSQGPLGKNMGG